MKNLIPSGGTLRAVLAGVLVALFACAGVVRAQDVPHKISYQGDIPGIADGPHKAAITLYTDASGTNPYWTATYYISTSGGIFSTVLGDSGVALPSPLQVPLYLGSPWTTDRKCVR